MGFRVSVSLRKCYKCQIVNLGQRFPGEWDIRSVVSVTFKEFPLTSQLILDR